MAFSLDEEELCVELESLIRSKSSTVSKSECEKIQIEGNV